MNTPLTEAERTAVARELLDMRRQVQNGSNAFARTFSHRGCRTMTLSLHVHSETPEERSARIMDLEEWDVDAFLDDITKDGK